MTEIFCDLFTSIHELPPISNDRGTANIRSNIVLTVKIGSAATTARHLQKTRKKEWLFCNVSA